MQTLGLANRNVLSWPFAEGPLWSEPREKPPFARPASDGSIPPRSLRSARMCQKRTLPLSTVSARASGWLNLLSLRGLHQAAPQCRRRVPRPTLEGVREGADLLKAEQPSDLGDR